MSDLFPEDKIPRTIQRNGETCAVISTMQNLHTRALLLRPRGEGPVWVSNAELVRLLTQQGGEE